MKLVGKYVVYDPPKPGFPYLGVLFVPEEPIRVVAFDSYNQAEIF